MIITGMKHFESVCQKKLVEWYNKNRPETPIDSGACDISGFSINEIREFNGHGM